MTPNAVLTDSGGNPITLADELGKGGEGAVHAVREHPSLVAKIYFKPPDKELVAKISAMARTTSPDVTALAAWPRSLVVSKGAPVGFLMPRVPSQYRPAFEAYGPKLRLKQFPQADWRFLIRAAANTADAFAVVHEAGQVIGDVNHGNLVIAPDASVKLIDCDSFQIQEGTRRWFCEVGVPTHQPPEMQGLKSYAHFVRTPNHDAFGLAVLVFQLLCLARHPYSGTPTTKGESPTIEESIKDYRYAYGGDRAKTRVTPPPGSLPMTELPPAVRAMFDTAFLESGSRNGRPTAREWSKQLRLMEGQLQGCDVNGGHRYLKTSQACPWCAIEARSNTIFFAAPPSQGKTSDGFAVIWAKVEAAKAAKRRPAMPPLPVTKPSDKALQARASLVTTYQGATVVALADVLGTYLTGANVITLGIAAAVIGSAAAIRKIIIGSTVAAATAAENDWARLQRDWTGNDATATRNQHLDILSTIRSEYDRLQTEKRGALRRLEDNRHASQMRDHLDRYQIAPAKITNIGAARKTTLMSYGIETAADVTYNALIAIPGFGPVTTGYVMDWRKNMERRFRFDASKAVSPQDVLAIENAYGAKGRILTQRATLSLRKVVEASQEDDQRTADLIERWRKTATRLSKASADLTAMTIIKSI